MGAAMRLTDLPEKYREQARNKYIEQCEHAPKITLRSEEQKDFEEQMNTANPISEGAYRIFVMGKPKGKGRPRFNTKTGKAYTPEATKKYESEIKKAWNKKYPVHIPLDRPVAVKVLAAFEPPESIRKSKRTELIGKPYPKKPDMDNICKIALDALNEVAWKDDNQVTELICKKIYDTKSYLMIEIR